MMEELSRAYVRAVAVRAGCTYRDTPDRDIGTDAVIEYVGWQDGRPRETGIHLRLQIKATSQDLKHTPAELIFDLKVDHYRKLIERSPGLRIILIVFDMPSNSERWLDTAPDGLVLRNCAYWECLEGKDNVPNASTVRIKIPRTQCFDVAAVQGPVWQLASREDALSEARRTRQRERRNRVLPTVGRRPAP